MSLRPELNIAETLGRFPPDLIGGTLFSLVSGTKRDLFIDARRFHDRNNTAIRGFENLEKIRRGPAFLVFNHPTTSVLVEGIMTLIYAIADEQGARRRDLTLVAAGEIPNTAGGYYAWSTGFMENFAEIYNHEKEDVTRILLVPNISLRPDYRSGRRKTVEIIEKLLGSGRVVALAAEGDWGKIPNQTKSDNAVRYGAGQIAINTYQIYHGNIIPVGIGVGKNRIPYLTIGQPLIPASDEKKVVALQIAQSIKQLLPAEMVVR